MLTPPLTSPGGLLIFATLSSYMSYFEYYSFCGCLVTCHILHVHGGVGGGGANNVLSPLLLAGALNFKLRQTSAFHAVDAMPQLFCLGII